jgi:hypothetical protein
VEGLTMPAISYTPVTTVLPEGIWPDDIAANDGATFLDNFACLIFDERADDESYFAFLRAKVMAEARIDLPLLDGTALVFGRGDTDDTGRIDIDLTATAQENGPPILELRILTTALSLSVSRDVLIPVSVAMVDGHLKVTQLPGNIGIPLPFALVVRFDGTDWSFDFDVPAGGSATALNLPLCQIGDTGVLVEATDLELNFGGSGTRPLGAALGWRGVYLGNAKLYIPDLFDGFFSTTGLGIGTGGFWGKLAANFALNYNANATPKFTGDLVSPLFGMEGGLTQVGISFTQNVPTAFSVSGKLLLPFFDEPVEVEIGIAGNSGFTAKLTSAGPNGLYKLSKPDVLEIELDSIGFELKEGLFKAKLSGEITPLFGKNKGLKWPAFKVQELSIDSKGHVHLEGGWLDLPKQYGFNFHGFKVDITKFGMGRNEDGTKWIGFSGGVKLVDGLPVGGSVDGLRITADEHWTPDSARISFDGVGVELDAKAFHFKGAVSYREFKDRDGNDVHRFDGDILLKLRSPELKIDGSLVVGSVAADKAKGTPAYNFFAIYVGVDLPTGTPIGATGLALYGINGLLAIEMAPDKKADEAWYAISPAKSWYKRPDPGVADLKKWVNARGSKAFGAGVTIGTYADNGFTFNGKVFFGIVFPGPLILIEGLANLLKDRAKLTTGDDPDYRALAVIDNRPEARSLLIGLDVKYQYDKSTGTLIKINAGTEAYYEFDNPSAWHIYLGIKEPHEQRIQADILSLFKANAYLMLDARQLAMGAWVGYDNSWKFGPLSVTLQAWMESNVVVSFKPAHLHGDLWVHGAVDLKAFGFGLGAIVDARLAADVFHPFLVVGDFEFELHLPWPLNKKHIGARVKLEWKRPSAPPPISAVLKDVAIESFKTSTKWPLSMSAIPPLLTPNYADADGFLRATKDWPTPNETSGPPPDAPIVPLDCRPSLSFARNVNDDALIGAIVQPLNPHWEQIGDPVHGAGPARIRYGVEEVRLDKWKRTGSTWAWESVAGKGGNTGSLPELFGTWAPINGTSVDGLGQNKLLLWSKTGFDHLRHTGAEWGNWFTGAYSAFPCFPAPFTSRICLDFENFDSEKHYSSPLTHPDHPEVHFIAPQGQEINDFRVTTFINPVAGQRKGLRQRFSTGSLTIIFDRPVNNLRIAAGLLGKNVPFKVDVFDKNGMQFGPFSSVNNVVDIDVRDVTSAVLVLPDVGTYYLLEVCADFGPVKKAAAGVRVDDIVIFTLKTFGLEILFSENFDGVTFPALPVGWTTGANGSELPWVTSAANPASAPNAAFAPDVNDIGNTELITPPIAVPAQGGFMAFQTLFNMDANPTPGVGFDGMVFEISMNGGAFADIITAGGSFDTGGYTHTISSDFDSPIAGRMAWTGLSGGTSDAPTYITTTVRLPDAARGQEIQLKWRVVTVNRARVLNYNNIAATTDATAQLESIRIHNWRSSRWWSARGNVLEPYTKYRLRMVTTAKMNEMDPQVLPQLAYFQTEGPPGLSTMTRPTEPPYPAELVDPSGKTKLKGGLDDLTLYVHQTIPPTVPKTGEPPLLPRPVYRGYDVGVLFNEDYVDLMYRLAGRDLSLLLYNRNNQPLRDRSGHLVVLDNPWGVNEKLSFNPQETAWLSLLKGSPCVSPIDLRSVPRDKTLQAAGEAQILEPDALYDARLMPLLVHEDFSRIPAGTLGRWQVSDLVTTGGPSHWQIEEFMPKSYRVIQTSGIGVSGTWQGTMLVLGNHPGLAAPDSSQPPMWSDYRVSLYPRSQDGTIGVAFRYVDDKHFYLFTMERPNGVYRLLRVADDEVLAENQITYVPNRDYHLVIEAIGDSLRIYLDETLLFDVTDRTIAKGGLALQCSAATGAAFSDIQVHDFSKEAKSVYHFPFTTSEFVDFVHHLHSFDDECWQASCTLTETELVDLDARSTSNQSSPIRDDEARAFERLADNTLGTSANQLAARTEITRIKREGSGDAAGFLLRMPEPIDWTRTSLGWAFGGQTVPSPLAPGSVKLVAASLGAQDPGGENVTLLVREPINLTGYRIEKRDLPTVAGGGPPAPDLDDPVSVWISVYEFGSENVIAPGTQIVVNSGNPDNAPPAVPRVLQRFRAPAGTPSDVQLAGNAADLRLVDPLGAVVHARRFLNNATNYNPVTFQVLRKADGTAFFLLPAGFRGFLPGTYQMKMDFRRDNTALDPDSLILSAAGQTAPEAAILDIPSATVSSAGADL